MENFLWVFYLIVLLATTSCALQEGAASEETTEMAKDQAEEMVTNPAEEDHITIANQGGESGASGSTIYVTLPPQDQAADVESMAPSSTMPSLATEAVPQPSSSPQVSSTTQATTKPPAAPQASANEIPPQMEEGKPMATSKSSHEKASAMESGAFPTTSSLSILVGVTALGLLVQS